jgi:hypothetical protein
MGKTYFQLQINCNSKYFPIQFICFTFHYPPLICVNMSLVMIPHFDHRVHCGKCSLSNCCILHVGYNRLPLRVALMPRVGNLLWPLSHCDATYSCPYHSYARTMGITLNSLPLLSVRCSTSPWSWTPSLVLLCTCLVDVEGLRGKEGEW